MIDVPLSIAPEAGVNIGNVGTGVDVPEIQVLFTVVYICNLHMYAALPDGPLTVG